MSAPFVMPRPDHRPHLAVVLECATSSRYFADALPALAACGYRVSVLAARDGGSLGDDLVSAGIPVRTLGAGGVFSYPLVARRLARVVAQDDVDLLHAHEPIAGALAASAFSHPSPRLVYHRHHQGAGRKLGALSRLAARRADLVLAVSDSAANNARDDDRISCERLRVAHNGVAVLPTNGRTIERHRRSLGIGPSDHVVTIVARLRPEKGHEVLFRAAHQVASHLPGPLHVVVVGDGPHRSRVESASQTANPAIVHLVGARDDVGSWLALADVVAVPSLDEPFGLAAIEALAACKPLVASRVGGLAEIVVDKVSGLLVPPSDAEALGDAIGRLLTDPVEADRLASGGYRRWTTRFTMEQMVARWVAAYHELGCVA